MAFVSTAYGSYSTYDYMVSATSTGSVFSYHQCTYVVSSGSPRPVRKWLGPQSVCRRVKFGSRRIIDWVVTLQFRPFLNSPPVPLSWHPVFALEVPQLIRMDIRPQRFGKRRRARLCSSSQALQPY